MKDETGIPQINISKVPIGSGLGGALAAAACVLIILLGLPELWYFVPGAIALGCVVALVLHFVRPKNPGAPWILPATKDPTHASDAPSDDSGRGSRRTHIRRGGILSGTLATTALGRNQ